MSKIPFNMKYRPQIESGEYLLIDTLNRPIRIVEWPEQRKDGKIVYEATTAGGWLVKGLVGTDGKIANEDTGTVVHELIIVTPDIVGLTDFEKAVQEAEEWMFKFGLDKITYEAVGEHNKRYSNVIANSNALIRMMMLCLDRSHCDGGDARVLKRLRSMPENGIFPEKTIERFRMKLVEVPEVGDRVRTTNHGLGTLELHVGNENWSVKLDNGESRILNEKHFTLL